MDFLNSSPVVSRMTPAKTTCHAELGRRLAPSFCVPLHHSQHTLVSEGKGRTEGLHTSHLALVKNVGSPQQEYPCMATEAHYSPTYGWNGLCRPRKRSRQER